MDSVVLNGETHKVRLPLHPIRFRLHTAFSNADGGYDGLAVCCAVLGACCPSVLGVPEVEQRASLRNNVIDFGERVLDRLVERGSSAEEVSGIAQKMVMFCFGLTPTDQEVESHADFTVAQAEVST